MDIPSQFISRHVSVELPVEAVCDLVRRYGEPHRAYHTAEHVADVLGWFDWVAENASWRDPVDVYLAILFHDAIYDPLSHDNEALSATLARDTVSASQRTQDLIRLTANHAQLSPALVEGDEDAARFLDCDLAIFAAAPNRFAIYDAEIEDEYRACHTAEQFRQGRSNFLRTMLLRPRIFLSELFHAEFDARARGNLRWPLARY
jgi:predicted metal-dependent HD superfamily phosphohydrolase